MNKLFHSKLKRYDVENIKEIKEEDLIFNIAESRMSGVQPLIVAETWKHYYYLFFWHDEKNRKVFALKQICCMEKSAMRKLVNVEKIIRLGEKLKDWNFNDQILVIRNLIENLTVTKPRNGVGSVWLLGSMFPEYLPYCSVLEVYYDDSRESLMPDLVFCHPNIWDETKSSWKESMLKEFESKSTCNKTEGEKTRLNNELREKITRFEEKFQFHLENSVRNPLNSVISRLDTDLKAIFFYLKDLEKELEKYQKSK